MINTYDIDGVINMGEYVGLRPQMNDIIITGRSVDEKEYTKLWLESLGIYNTVFFNPQSFNNKTRQNAGLHKANIINILVGMGVKVGLHFEDDPIQADIIEKNTNVKVVRLVHDLVEKENVWHGAANDNPSIRSNRPTDLE